MAFKLNHLVSALCFVLEPLIFTIIISFFPNIALFLCCSHLLCTLPVSI